MCFLNFVIGVGDRTRCFCCGGGLSTWERGDDPWVEHARYFKQCPYLVKSKGLSWVKEVCSEPVPVALSLEKKRVDVNHYYSALECKICFDDSVSVVFMPCRHLVACFLCATSVRRCAICRTDITSIMRVFLS